MDGGGGEGRGGDGKGKKCPSIKYDSLKGCVSLCRAEDNKSGDTETWPNGNRHQSGVR